MKSKTFKYKIRTSIKMSSSSGFYFFDRSSNRSNASNPINPHYQEKTNTASSSLAIRNRKISKSFYFFNILRFTLEIVNFGDPNFNSSSGAPATNTTFTKGHTKTSSAASNAILNTTAPICITSLNGSAIATPAGHSRVPSASSSSN